MRIRTQRVLLAASFTVTCSCASQPHSVEHAGAERLALESVNAKQAEQARRIEELESRIALLEADARQARGGDAPAAHGGDTIRIGGARDLSTVAPATPVIEETNYESEEAARAVRRPRLRLYGKGGGGGGGGAEPRENRETLPTVPTVSETLPVVPLPEQRAAQMRPAAVSGDAMLAGYRSALRLLRERRFDEALEAFNAFIAANPRHALLPNALYWRGEVRYAKRDYASALADFEDLLQRFPRGEKAADALFKTALCLRQLGSEDKAREAFRRLRSDFPNSQAASMAAREGST